MSADGISPLGASAAPVGGSPAPVAPAATAAAEASGAGKTELREAAEALEGVFLSMLTKELFKGTEAFESSPIYGDLATEQFASQLGRDGGFGLADLLVEQLGGNDGG